MLTSLPFPSAAPALNRSLRRHLTGAGVTLIIHLVMLAAWQLARAPLPGAAETGDARPPIQWLRLPPLTMQKAAAVPLAAPLPVVQPRLGTPPVVAAPVPPAVPATAPAVASEAAPPAPAETIMEKARRSAGSIDRALRMENRPYLAAPHDSPEIRMRRGMEEAHAVAAPRLWEAPKIDALVNQTGDGTRRERIITGLGTYCITERATNTDVEMIEHHGKIRITNCPQHESTANGQEWRTARDW